MILACQRSTMSDRKGAKKMAVVGRSVLKKDVQLGRTGEISCRIRFNDVWKQWRVGKKILRMLDRLSAVTESGGGSRVGLVEVLDILEWSDHVKA